MDFDRFMFFFIPLFLLFCFILIILFFYKEIKIDLELWKDNREIVTYSECRNYEGVFYCIKESELKHD